MKGTKKVYMVLLLGQKVLADNSIGYLPVFKAKKDAEDFVKKAGKPALIQQLQVIDDNR